MSIRGDIASGEFQPQECSDPMHQPKARTGKRFPHANIVLIPVQEFNIKGHWLCLYQVKGRDAYVLHWADDLGPARDYLEQTLVEVFATLARLLNCWDPRSGR